MKKVDGPDTDKSEWIKLEFLMHPDNPVWGSKYSQQLAIFKDGLQRDWEADAHEGIFWQDQDVSEFVEGPSLVLFWTSSRLEAEDSDIPDNELIELVLRDIVLEYILKHTMRVQKYYMRQPRGLYMGLHMSVQQFVERLNDLNRYLLHFSEENPKQLDQDEIIEILDQAKAWNPEWHEAMVNANIDIFEMTYEESVSYFKRLEYFENIRRTNGTNPSSLPVDNKNEYLLPSV
jgi:hypothetical protein